VPAAGSGAEASLAALADRVRRGDLPAGSRPLRRNPVRASARIGDLLLKAWMRPSSQPRREARAIGRAHALGLRVPVLVGVGDDWIATRWIDARPATRADLAAILATVARMHAAGMLHGDLHLGNLLADGDGVVLTDLQRARFLPALPGPLRRRELGFLAYSLGEPLPGELAHVRFWRDVRAQRHWRSRTRRCVVESGGFTAFEARGARGFRRRDADAARLARALDSLETAPPRKVGSGGSLYRIDGLFVKAHASVRRARRAWLGGNGLEARGIATARPLAWAGRWLVMEDAGATLADWADGGFAASPPAAHDACADALGDLLAALHRRGIYHADLKANNVAFAPGAPPRLLDYARVRFGRRVRLGRRVKNLAQLNAALPDAVHARFRERAFARYLAASEFRGDPDELRRRVIALSLSRRHRWSGC
jgi:tRNA A-37 threonylcarbamoyl transferase component Bud32